MAGFHIDKISYHTENYYKDEQEKSQIIICASNRKSNYHIIRQVNVPDSYNWSCYSISRTGEIYEHYDPKYYTNFMGIEQIDQIGITIVLENMGIILYENGEYFNWMGEKCENEDVYEKVWDKYQYWEKYPNKQYKSLIWLCKKLCADFNIPCESVGFNFFHENTVDFDGIVCRSNYYKYCYDLNPSFNFDDFNSKLKINDKNKTK